MPNIRLSYSTPGTPTENPGQESFFGRLKEDCQDEWSKIESFKKLDKFITQRMKYYNRKRIHTSINYQSPFKFTNSFIKKHSLKTNRKITLERFYRKWKNN